LFAPTNARNDRRIFGIRRHDRRAHMWISRNRHRQIHLLQTLIDQDIAKRRRRSRARSAWRSCRQGPREVASTSPETFTDMVGHRRLILDILTCGDISTITRLYRSLKVDTVHQPDTPRTPETTPTTLTNRELAVLSLIAKGKTTKDIAAIFGLSTATVSVHCKRICRKLDVHSTAELVRRAIALIGG
jgi:DNA-binding NarL/FixJ family response regulator